MVSGPAAHDLFHAVMGRTLSMTLVSALAPLLSAYRSSLLITEVGALDRLQPDALFLKLCDSPWNHHSLGSPRTPLPQTHTRQ